MAETVTISRKERPVSFRQKSTINPENLERNFRHADEEINKLYQILGGDNLSRNQGSRTIVVGGGSGGGVTIGSPADAEYVVTALNAQLPNAKLIAVSGELSLTKTATGILITNTGVDAGSDFWQSPVISKNLTAPPI